jgi:hypothetical protein
LNSGFREREFPHYQVEFSVKKSDNSGYVIRGKLLQTGVPNSFITRVPLYISVSANHSVLLGTVTAAGPETTFHFNSPIPARKVQIDPQLTILCTTE